MPSRSKTTPFLEIGPPSPSLASLFLSREPQWENSLAPWGVARERRHPAGSPSLDSRPPAARHGVLRVQGNHPHGGKELLLRLPGSAAPQTRSPLRRLRFHAS